MNIRPILAVAVAGGALSLLGVPAAHATSVTYGFGCITSNSATDCAIGEAQLTMTVFDTALPADQIGFRFDNIGLDASSITRVYFDDDADVLAAFFGQNDSGAGVDFALNPATGPANLPGGNSIVPPFNTTGGLLAGSTPPVEPNGVNPGEWLVLYVTLSAGKTPADVLAALADQSLRVGIHVQGFESGGSVSLVNTPGNPVPEPGSLLLLGTGLGSLILRRLRKS